MARLRVSGTRGLRFVRREIRRSSRFATDPDVGRVHRLSDAQGLRPARGLRVGTDAARRHAGSSHLGGWHYAAHRAGRVGEGKGQEEMIQPLTDEKRYTLTPGSEGLIETQTLEVSIGPQHPSTHGVFRMDCTLDGETVVALKPVMGYQIGRASW